MIEQKIEQKHNVFVYGTLRKGCPNHWKMASAIKSNNACFKGEATTHKKYAFYLEHYVLPAVNDRRKLYAIKGEIYSVSDQMLNNLDHFENHPDWYVRKEIPVLAEEGLINAWIYFLPSTTTKPQPHGDYCSYLNEAQDSVANLR